MFLPLVPLALPVTNHLSQQGIETTIIRCHDAADGTLVCDDVRYYDDGSDCIKIYGHEGPGTYFERDCN